MPCRLLAGKREGERRPAGRSGAAGASGRRPLKPPRGRFALRAVSLRSVKTRKGAKCGPAVDKGPGPMV